MNKKTSFDKVHYGYNMFMKTFRLFQPEQVKKMLSLKGDERILDIGGGTGYLAHNLQNNCESIYIVDESEGMLSHVKTNNKISAIQADFFELNLKPNSFDVVILSDVIHHIKEVDKLIHLIIPILTRQGKILIFDFDNECFMTKLLGIFEYVMFGKVNYYSPFEMINILKKHGLVSTEYQKIGFTYLMVGYLTTNKGIKKEK